MKIKQLQPTKQQLLYYMLKNSLSVKNKGCEIKGVAMKWL